MSPHDPRRISDALMLLRALEGAVRPRLRPWRSDEALETAARRALDAVDALSDRELAQVDARMRRWAGPSDPPPRLVNLAGDRRPEVARAAMIACWGARSGYTRQIAVRRMESELPWSLRFVAFRATDWVRQVRRDALELLAGAPEEALVAQMPLLESLGRERTRGEELLAVVDARLAAGEAGTTALWDGTRSSDRYVRRLSWRRLLAVAPEEVAGELERAAGDDDVVVRSWAARIAAALPGAPVEAVADALWRDPVGQLRAQALATLVELRPREARELLLTALGDRSGSVRGMAHYHYAHLGGDAARFYRERIEREPVVRDVVSLGETGGVADVPLLQSLLNHDSATVRAAAVRSLTGVDPGPPTAALAALDDPAPAVVRSALRSLRRRRLPPGQIEQLAARATTDPRPEVRVAALKLIWRAPWQWLAASLTLREDDPDDGVRATAERELGHWVQRAAELYSSPTPEQRAAIERRLPSLAPPQRQAIEFALRTS